MLHVYINYPNPHMTIHGDSGCSLIRQSKKPDQRISKITVETLSQELAKFRDKEYSFAPAAILNGIWLDIDLNDSTFERAVAEYVLELIGRYYTPLRGIKSSVHC